MQALYQQQIAGHELTTLRGQFTAADEFEQLDGEYFLNLLEEIHRDRSILDGRIEALADRPVEQIDPVERAVLWIGITELGSHPDVPVKVVIDEAIELAKEFGAQDGYRYVNAVLDSVAKELR